MEKKIKKEIKPGWRTTHFHSVIIVCLWDFRLKVVSMLPLLSVALFLWPTNQRENWIHELTFTTIHFYLEMIIDFPNGGTGEPCMPSLMSLLKCVKWPWQEGKRKPLPEQQKIGGPASWLIQKVLWLYIIKLVSCWHLTCILVGKLIRPTLQAMSKSIC